MVVILPVFRAILTGAGAFFALHLTNPQLTEPLYELALAGAKELAVFGANALSSRFDIFAWLLGTGAAWNSIRLAEKAKHALGQLYEAGEHYALHPARVKETLEDNAKWLGLLNVDLSDPPLHAAAYGKELMVVPQPFINIDVCIPGEVGWWDADAAAAFEAAIDDIVDVSIVPDPPDQGVCVAVVGCNETIVSLSSTAAAAAFSTTTTATAFFRLKVAAFVVLNSTAIVVEPAIAGGHVAQPTNAFTAGCYAHDSGPPLHGHMSNSTSASAIAPLAVPKPTAAINVTEVRALVHWDPEVQPYERAALHARAADQVHWYLIITFFTYQWCLVLVLSVSCMRLAIRERERATTDPVFNIPSSTAAPLALADIETAIVPDNLQDITPVDTEEEDDKEDKNIDTIDEDDTAITTVDPDTVDTAPSFTTPTASLALVIFEPDLARDYYRGLMRANAEGQEGRTNKEQDRDTLGIDSDSSTVVEDTTTTTVDAITDAASEDDAPAPVVLDVSLEVELSDDKNACKIDTDDDEAAAVGLLGSIWARQDGDSENTALTAPEPALNVEEVNYENKSMKTILTTSTDTVSENDAPMLAPAVRDFLLEVEAGMVHEKDEPAEADGAVGLRESIWAPRYKDSENTAPTAPELVLNLEDAHAEKSMAPIITAATDTVNKTDAPALAPVVQGLSLEVEVKMDSDKDEKAEAEDDTAPVGLLKSIWAPQAQDSQDTGSTPTVPELALEIGDADTADKSAQKTIGPSVDDDVVTETVLTGVGIGASMWATQVELDTSTISDNADTTLVELEVKATDKREDHDEAPGTKASMWAPKNEIRTYHGPATASVFFSEVDTKTQDKDVTVGTKASIWASKDNAETDRVPATDALTAYAAKSAVEDSIPLACGVTDFGAGVVTGSGGDSDATTTVPHNSAIVNLEQYKLDQSCLSDAAKNELAAAAWSKRTWGGKKRLFTLLPAFKEAITEDAVASTSRVPPPAATTPTPSAPPTAGPALAPAPALVPGPGHAPALAPVPALVPAPVLNAQQRRAKKRRAAEREERRVREEEQNAAWAAQTALLTGIKKDTPLDSVYGADWKERFPQMQERLLATRWLTVYPEGGAAAVLEGGEGEKTA